MLTDSDIGFISNLVGAALERFAERSQPKVCREDQLHELQHLVWLLANLIHGRLEPDDGASHPHIRFMPGIADYGNWVCIVDIDMGSGNKSSISGSIESNIVEIRKRIRDRLGHHCRF